MRRLLPFVLLTGIASIGLAQNPAPAPATPAPAPAATPKPAPVPPPQLLRRVPPGGVAITDADRAALNAQLQTLAKEIETLRTDLKSKPELFALLPDVEIFHKAVDWALRYDEFFSPGQVGQAKQQLEMGLARAKELRAGTSSWTTATGLVVRGYQSKIDGSIQPYGIVVPEEWKAEDKTLRRTDFFCHGRGEKLSELDFINQRLNQKGEFTPPGAFVIHPYGRYCCANKFAGEVDLFEALNAARRSYPIDNDRLVIRGFSMGGGAAWQFGTHFAGLWAAVQPGAGFGESKEFLKLGTTPDKPLPSEWEQKLWRWYDSTVYVPNLHNTTTVAYSGETDGQIQAAQIMLRFAEPEGVKIEHVVGPQTAHKIRPESKPEIEALLDPAVKKGAQPKAAKVHLTTYSLVYPKMKWVEVTGLEKQWERADLTAEVKGDKIVAQTKNITAVRFSSPVEGPASDKIKEVSLDGQTLAAQWDKTGAQFHREAGQWKVGAPAATSKNPQTCGPIDHAFMDSFVFVRPTGKVLNKNVGDWVEAELGRAVTQWRAVFRGNARVVADNAVSEQDIQNSNLVLWGDPSSNAILKKIADKLPFKWDAKEFAFGGKTYDANNVAPVLIFPNPLNPSKYIVLNSGFTFREAAAINNAQQTPKLPDWAIVDLRTAPDAYFPGKVVRAGFFNEQWQPPTQ